MNSYVIEEKRVGQYGSSDVRVVRGTGITISKGVLQVWNALLEGGSRARLVTTVAVDRVLTFKSQVIETNWDGVDRRLR